MKTINDFIGKKVVALSQGACIGYVLDVTFDENLKKMNGIVIVDEENEDEKFLSNEKLLSQNDEYIFVESAFDCENIFQNQSTNPVGKIVFSENGDDLGRVEDVVMEKSNVQKIVTNKSEINVKNIIVNGSDFLIFGKNNKKIKKNEKIFNKNVKNMPKIEIQQIKIENQKNDIAIPTKIYSSSRLLIGKLTTNDVFGYNNELIIKKNEIITKNIIEKAKKHNKLTFLMFNCK